MDLDGNVEVEELMGRGREVVRRSVGYRIRCHQATVVEEVTEWWEPIFPSEGKAQLCCVVVSSRGEGSSHPLLSSDAAKQSEAARP